MKKTILAAAILSVLSPAAYAQAEFSLNSVSLEGVRAVQASAPAMAVAPAQQKSAALPSGLDVSLKLPFAALNRKLSELTGEAMQPGVAFQISDPTAPVFSRSGEHVVLQNLIFDLGGIEVVPTATLKPWFEGVNRLAIKVVNVEADIAFGPNKSLPQIDKNELMAMAFEKVTAAVLASMNNAFAKNKVALRAEDVLAFAYDKPSWTLRVRINPTFIAPLLPGLVRDINLTHFGLSDEGFSLSMKSGSAVNLSAVPGYNLGLSDGLLTSFVAGYTAGSDFDIAPEGRDGGIRFRADGVTEFAGKIYARDFFLKPNVYFSAKIKPEVTATNTIKMKVQRVDVDKAYGIGVPGFLNNWLQGKIVSSVVEEILNNKSLAKVMTAKKISDDTVKLTLKDAAVLPSFAQGMKINGMRVAHGVLYLAFEL